MNEQEQRIAIAEACGWADIRLHPHIVDGWPDILGGFCPRLKCRQSVPDYLHDLNAMHEAEKFLTESSLYEIELEKQYRKWQRIENLPDAKSHHWHCPAHQRAEAFLRTIGKWKD